MRNRVPSQVPRCQRWRWLVLAVFVPVPALAAGPVTISNPTATIDAGTGGLRLEVDVENSLPVAINSVVLSVGPENGRDLVLQGTVDAGTSSRLWGESSAQDGGDVEVRLKDYRLASALDWPEARRLLELGGAAEELNFLRQLHITGEPTSLGPNLGAPIPTEPTMDEVIIWTARVLWGRCRGGSPESLNELRKRSEIGALEDGFSLLRGAWLVQGRARAPLSAAIPREIRRFAQLLEGAACPIPAPLESPETLTPSNPPRTDPATGSDDQPSIALWIAIAIIIFVAGILLGRRQRNE